jgi:hypothetical protein
MGPHVAAAAAAFNLVCSGTYTSNIDTGKPSRPYQYVYRLDLGAKKWCDGECKVQRPIAKIDPTVLTLVDERTDSLDRKGFAKETIDRETGRHSIERNSTSRLVGLILITWEGQCEKAAFTGFPEFKTKF